MINSIMVFFMRDSCQEYINNLPEIMFYAKEICHLPLPKTKFSIVVYTSNIKAWHEVCGETFCMVGYLLFYV